jgi:uncharacterized protein (UPF0332 family)
MLKSQGLYYDVSVQCAYYACLQLVQHLLNQAKIELDYKEASSHQKIAEALREWLKREANDKIARTAFNRLVGLKNYRVKAAYEQDLATEHTSKYVLNEANSFLDELNKLLKS